MKIIYKNPVLMGDFISRRRAIWKTGDGEADTGGEAAVTVPKAAVTGTGVSTSLNLNMENKWWRERDLT